MSIIDFLEYSGARNQICAAGIGPSIGVGNFVASQEEYDRITKEREENEKKYAIRQEALAIAKLAEQIMIHGDSDVTSEVAFDAAVSFIKRTKTFLENYTDLESYDKVA